MYTALIFVSFHIIFFFIHRRHRCRSILVQVRAILPWILISLFAHFVIFAIDIEELWRFFGSPDYIARIFPHILTHTSKIISISKHFFFVPSSSFVIVLRQIKMSLWPKMFSMFEHSSTPYTTHQKWFINFFFSCHLFCSFVYLNLIRTRRCHMPTLVFSNAYPCAMWSKTIASLVENKSLRFCTLSVNTNSK